MHKFRGLPLCRSELFYHNLPISWHNSDQIAEFLISSALKPCIVLMLPGHCIMTKVIIPIVRVALAI